MPDTLLVEKMTVNPRSPRVLYPLEKAMDLNSNSSALNLSTDARLDMAADRGWQSWITVAAARSPDQIALWISNRSGGELTAEQARELVPDVLDSTTPATQAQASADMAELLADADPLLATLLWEGVLSAGKELADSELVFEGASRLAEIEEMYGDPLSAAEILVDFLNWRRAEEHVSDPESVLTAFDEIIRLAEEDDASEAAARFQYEQARFLRLVEEQSPLAETGEWLPDAPPFSAWDDA